MLRTASIRHIALIDRADIAFAGGVCVFTGETGAGKSILLKSLCFAVGAASGAGLTRHGEQKGEVTLEFDHISARAQAILEEHDLLDGEDASHVILRRTANPEGRGKVYINDSPCSVKLLKQLGETLLEIHGQHDQRGFTDAVRQRDALDRFGELTQPLSHCADAYQTFRAADNALNDFTALRDKVAQERDYYAFALRELERLEPAAGLEDSLQQQRDTMRNAAKIEEALAIINTCMEGDEDGGDGIRALYAKIARAAEDIARFVPAAAETFAKMESAFLDVDAAAEAIRHSAVVADREDASIEAIEDRLYALRAAARKYDVPSDDLPSVMEEAREALDDNEDASAKEQRLQQARDKALDAYDKAAHALHVARTKAADTLSSVLSDEIQALHMRGAEVMVQVNAQPDKRSASGSDDIVFLLKSNAGMPFAPLSDIASGGELSRCMLAFKAALSASQEPMSMIFDEIDTGISGAVSEAVGDRLRLLSGKHQVFAVTHQPQVAGAADSHYLIRKQDTDGATFTSITALSRDERQEELARLLSGAEISREARDAAKKLLKA